jgi:hypothetical protein
MGSTFVCLQSKEDTTPEENAMKKACLQYMLQNANAVLAESNAIAASAETPVPVDDHPAIEDNDVPTVIYPTTPGTTSTTTTDDVDNDDVDN